MDSGEIINQILLVLRNGGGMQAMLEFTCRELTEKFKASHTIIWLVVGDSLQLTECFPIDKRDELKRIPLNSMESMAIILEFLSRFPDEKGTGVFALPEEADAENIYSDCGDIVDKLKFQSQLLAQLRSRGIFSGFIDIQNDQARLWSAAEQKCLQEVSIALSVLVGQICDAWKLAADLSELKAARSESSATTSI